MAKQKHNYETPVRDVVLLQGVEDIEPYSITLPEPPPLSKMKNYGLPPSEQYYVREKVPNRIWHLTRQVNNKEITREQARNEVMKDADLSEWIASQWHKREHGEWILINGKPLYITNIYWFFLNYYHLDTGLPQFRETDMKKHWWWKFCVEENENVYGGIDFTRRRVGKTFFAGNILLEAITKTPNAQCGLQSKSDIDAAKAFGKAVMNPFKRLPFFFKPDHDNSDRAKKKIEFVSDNVEESFECLVDYGTSTATYYDGQKIFRYLLDEAGKMLDPADPIAIWDKVKFCLFLDGKVIGKALVTTTIEEMERGGGAKFKYLWDRSSRIQKLGMIDEYGETKSGLVPYFTPSYENMFFDQYGFSIVDDPKPYQAEYRYKAKDKHWNMGGKGYVNHAIENAKDGKDRQDLIRKMPRTIKEAFSYNNMGCLFDINIINQRLGDFIHGYPESQPMTFGFFDWEGERFNSKVKFVPTDEKTARCHIRHLPTPDQRNAWTMKNGKQAPVNTAKFQASADPFKYNTDRVLNKDKMSQGAAHVFAMFDPAIESMEYYSGKGITDNFVLEYMYRPPTPDEYAEDVLKICIFYGCTCFPEFNVDVVDKFFRQHGFEEYLQFKKKWKSTGTGITLSEDKTQSGSNTTEQFKPVLIRHMVNYVQRMGLNCPFPRTLEQIRDLEYSNFNDYDLAVSAMYSLVAIFDITTQKKQTKKVNLGDLIPKLHTWRN